MKKYLIGVTGYYGNGISAAGGQEAKTCSLTRAFVETYGTERVSTVDTRDWKKRPVAILAKLVSLAKNAEHVFMLPAQNGVRVFAPLFYLLKGMCCCKIHYAVVGGWLPMKTENDKLLRWVLQRLDGVYVETRTMKESLEAQGFSNVAILPNFKFIKPVPAELLQRQFSAPYRVCTFSRVMKEKGIEDAVEAVKEVNEKAKETVLLLDIYGKIDPGYEQRFCQLMKEFPAYVRYCGMVEPEQSVEVLKDYFALLFPTYYEGEGFPGTLIDAYCAGVPVIASDWRYNTELVNENVGIIYPSQNNTALVAVLQRLISNPTQVVAKRVNCLKEVGKYNPEKVINQLIMGINDC